MSTHYFRVGNVVTRIADGACIPEDEGNDDYVRFLREADQNATDPTFLVDGYDPRVALSDVQDGAMAEADAEAERIRLRYITPGFGQAQVYAAKLQQAQEWQSASANDRKNLTKWPLIESEVAATGMQSAAAVAAIINTAKDWIKAAAKIETIRLKCKQRIAAAATVAEVIAARDDGLGKLRAISKQ